MANLAQDQGEMENNPPFPFHRSRSLHVGKERADLSSNECRDLISIWMTAFAWVDRATDY
jgi:hypothetical protein